MNIRAGMIKGVLEADRNDARFEEFCVRLLSDVEGMPIVVTSRTYDQGRDGRSIRTGKRIVLASSITDDVPAKVEADLGRLQETNTSFDRLYFCSSRALTEHASDKIEKVLERRLGVSREKVSVLGSIQLADLASRAREVVLEYYFSELKSLEVFSEELGESPRKVELRALRLALMVKDNPDSSRLRKGILNTLVLLALGPEPRSNQGISRTISDKLRLGRSIPEIVIERTLRGLQRQGTIRPKGGGWLLTDLGKERVARLTEEEVYREAAEGRRVVIEDIERRIGRKLSRDHGGRVWSALQDRISHLFYLRGAEVVELVRAVAEGGAIVSEGVDVIGELQRAVEATTEDPVQREELHTAVGDIFRDRASAGYEWLATVCCAFISLCCLGVERETAQQLCVTLRTIGLVLDTDVVLSLLCEGEPNHEGVEQLCENWTRDRRRLYVVEDVLTEVTKHAERSQRDFEEARDRLPVTETEGQLLLSTAFVRAFSKLLREGEARLGDWGHFISQFRSLQEGGSAVVADLLRNEHGIERLELGEEASGLFPGLEVGVAAALEKSANPQESVRIRGDKARRDGRMFADVCRKRAETIKQGQNASYLICSSSTRLARVENDFKPSEAGDRPLVADVGTVMAMLSFVPGVSIGLSGLRKLLFEERGEKGLSQFHRFALRIVHASKQYSAPWARRSTLLKRLDAAIVQRARDECKDPDTIRKDLARTGNEATAAQAIGEVLDSMALDSEEVTRLRAEIEQLRARGQSK